ncbi:hypothetical protein [Paenibacillus ehimensis]|uniref:Uncharacterized protein n=1 Tax=Paenibacillus ehimensis TaxID=79264 RepID=A0ABT8V4N8_9BACL|nr:hypothetical protein [Paenibacillus ehimensis]MDO3676380.1 hypothetical protein [Paenibacillus ehimensis]
MKLKWNLQTIGGFVLMGIGLIAMIGWGGISGLFGYIFALIMIGFGYWLWRTADTTLKRVCSGLVMLAGAALIIFWLPQVISLVLAAAIIFIGWILVRNGQSQGYRHWK